MQKKEKLRQLLTLFVILMIGVLWYFLSRVVPPVMIPAPSNVAVSFFTIMKEGYKNIPLLTHLGVSLRRLVIAFFFAVFSAVPLGLASGHNASIRAVFEPLIEFFRPLPPLAYYTLIVLWMGIDDSSKVALLGFAAFAPIYVSCAAAMQRVSQNYINTALSLGASQRQIFFQVSFPAVLPEIFVGIRTALGVAYTTLVAAEMVAATSGIGWLVLDASRYLRSDIIFMGIFIMGFTGIALDRIIRSIESKIVFWNGHE